MTSAPVIPQEQMEKYSSAVTLSDMEIFVFPELLYSLVLANIMSPLPWSWRDDKWFRGIRKKTPYRRVMRLKQFIMDNFDFNLDLETWGLTDRERELQRFAPWMNSETIAASNALFGYQGDRYYFSIDIRRHFGLDKYDRDRVPYWKTETVEAMNAFRYRQGYDVGAGECVSLSTLYAAALFVVCGIPLKDIYLMATPLHSQNYIDVRDGVLTNNRRVVTKTMWFNGSELSAKAQRALRNERVTMVAHSSGWIHTVYPQATIDLQAYEYFRERLGNYLTTAIDMETLCNFLRYHSELQCCFQLQHQWHGRPRFIPLEKVYSYEHNSPYRVNGDTRDKLLSEIDGEEFEPQPLEGRIHLEEFDACLRNKSINPADRRAIESLVDQFDCRHQKKDEIMEKLLDFIHIRPQLPDAGKRQFSSVPAVEPAADMPREEIIEMLQSMRSRNPVADLAFYAWRDLSRTNWEPFLRAALERNPVCIEATESMSDEDVISALDRLPGESIYEGTRAAQPDEVWNFGRGDGLERAICLAAIMRSRHPRERLHLEADGRRVLLTAGRRRVEWPGSKGIAGEHLLHDGRTPS